MSKRSKACEISQKLKEIVWNRDSQKCICCGKWVPKSCANAHYIKRSQRRVRHRRKCCYIMPRLPSRGRFWAEHQTIRRTHKRLLKREIWGQLERGKINL